MQNSTNSPPRAPSIQYRAPLGTRWAKEKAAAGGSAAFDLATDPKTIGPWILGECIGKGASGRVKIAKHGRTGQLAAVKILPIAPLVSSRASLATQQAKTEKQRLGIDREITMMKLMNHPNIMRIYDVYEGEKELFLVLEYVEGGELFDFLVNRGRLPTHEALIYFRQIVYGLNYAHTFSIIHRDLKPENILIASLSPPVIKIADWGMAAFAPPCLQLETSCGSPHYASPEIVNGEKYQGNATDIWSCGVILYALLTGRLPFDDKNVRNLLSKVKSGKYDMPSWIDPLAKDLLSKMLVVDVNKRITIPEILSHPWLLSYPSIPFSASDGTAYTLLAPPLPPSPSVLARPIASPGLIDSDLFSSLRVIWGRHADVQGESIRRDLCSPAGQGVHAKAFYFLLGKYREESSKNCLSDSESEVKLNSARSIIDLEALKLNLAWGLEQSGNNGLRKYDGPKIQTLFSTPHATSSAQASVGPPPPAYPAKMSLGRPPTVASRKRTVTDGSLPTKFGTDYLPESCGPSTSKAQVEHWKARMKAQQESVTAAKMDRPPSTLGVGRGGPRPLLPRRGQTYSMVPEKRSGDGPAAAIPAPGFSQHFHHLQARNASVSTSARPTSSAGPGTPFTEAEKIAMFSPKPAATNGSIETPSRQAPSTAAPRMHAYLDLPLLTAPKTEDPHLQRTMDDLTQKVNELVQAISQPPLAEVASAKGTIDATGQRRNKRTMALECEDKENASMEEGWSHVSVNSSVDRSGAIGLGVGGISAHRNVGKDVSNVNPVACSPTKLKKEKEKKVRPPPLELPTQNTKRSTFAMLGSPIVLSSPIHQPPSSATRIMASPVVGEFKGWFSNLFNWKQSNGNGGVLYSVEGTQRTRTNVSLILEAMGIVVVKTPSDYHQEFDILVCRIDHPTTNPVTGVCLKNIRFRVEFRASPGPSQLQTGTCFHEEQSDFLAGSTNASNPVTPTNTFAISPGSTSRPRGSVLLGGRSSSQGTPLPSPAMLSKWEYSSGCQCAVVLIHEKGSMSTFRAVWRKLKEEYADPTAAYPCFSPAIPSTPHSESCAMAL